MADQLPPAHGRPPALSNATSCSIQKTPPSMVAESKMLPSDPDDHPPELNLNDCTSIPSKHTGSPSVVDNTRLLSVENEPPEAKLNGSTRASTLNNVSGSSSIETNPPGLIHTPGQPLVAVMSGGHDIESSRSKRVSSCSSIETNLPELKDRPRLLLDNGLPERTLVESTAAGILDPRYSSTSYSSGGLEYFPDFSGFADSIEQAQQKPNRRDSAVAPPLDFDDTLRSSLASGDIISGHGTGQTDPSDQPLLSGPSGLDPPSDQPQYSGSGRQLHGNYLNSATSSSRYTPLITPGAINSSTQPFGSREQSDVLHQELEKHWYFERDQHDKAWKHVTASYILPKSSATEWDVRIWILAWLFTCYSRPEGGNYSQDSDDDRISVINKILRRGNILLRADAKQLKMRVRLLIIRDGKLRKAVIMSVSEHGQWLQNLQWNGSSVRGRPDFYELRRDIETAQAPDVLGYISKRLALDILKARADLGTTDKALAILYEKAKKTKRPNRRKSQKNENTEIGTYTPSQMSLTES